LKEVAAPKVSQKSRSRQLSYLLNSNHFRFRSITAASIHQSLQVYPGAVLVDRFDLQEPKLTLKDQAAFANPCVPLA